MKMSSGVKGEERWKGKHLESTDWPILKSVLPKMRESKFAFISGIVYLFLTK